MRPLLPAMLSLCCAALTGACDRHEPTPPAAQKVLVQPAQTGDSNRMVYTGEVRARREVDLAFRVGGKIAARLVDSGMNVKAGQALARLDPADLRLAEQAAAAQVAAAESDYNTASADRDRYAGLLEKRFVSQAAYEAKENAWRSAAARLEQARAQSRISGNQAAYGTLTAETDGVITAVLADAGQVVSAGQAVMRLARPEEKEIAIAIPESRLAELKSAREITVALWARPEQQLKGELRELAAAADPATRTYAARIRLTEPAPEAALGMTAQVFVSQGESGGVTVPLTAVVDNGQGPRVWVVENGQATPKVVEVGRFTESGVQIASGIGPGDTVIVTGQRRLTPGLAVSPQPVTPPEQQR